MFLGAKRNACKCNKDEPQRFHGFGGTHIRKMANTITKIRISIFRLKMLLA